VPVGKKKRSQRGQLSSVSPERPTTLSPFLNRLLLYGLGATVLGAPLFFFVKPYPAWGKHFQVINGGGFKFALLSSLIAALLVVWAIIVRRQGALLFRRSPLNLPVLLFLLACLISIVRAANLYQAVVDAWQLVVMFAFLFFLILNNLYLRENLLWLMRVSLVGGVVVSVIGALQHFNVGFSWLPHYGPGATLVNKNLAAEYLLFVIPYAAALFFLEKGWARKALSGCALALFAAHLLFTETRGAWLGLVSSLALAAVVLWISFAYAKVREGMRARRVLALSLAWVCVATGVVGIAGGIVVTRFPDNRYVQRIRSVTEFDRGSVSYRLLYYGDALRMVRDHPVWGIGMGNFDIQYPLYATSGPEVGRWAPVDREFVRLRHAHNDYLEIAAETGLPGIASFLAMVTVFFVMVAKTFFRLEERGDREGRLGLMALLMGQVAFLVSCLFGFPFRMPATCLFFWMTMALASCLYLEARAEKTSREGAAVRAKEVPRRIYRVPRATGNALIVVSGLFCISVMVLSYRSVQADSYELLGQAHKYAGQMEEALACYVESSRYNPYAFHPHAQAAFVAWQLKRFDVAYREAKEGLAYHPNDILANLIFGNALTERGRWEEAIFFYRNVVSLKPDYAEGHNNLAVAYLTTGDVEKAVEHFNRALRYKEDFPEAYRMLGYIYEKRGDLDRGAQYLQKSLDLNPNISDAQLLRNKIEQLRERQQRDASLSSLEDG
jgi:O-antigen ligase/Flp pilus assembly protein TadD